MASPTDPIRRILGALLSYALRDQAREIRITPTARGALVHYRIEDAWHHELDFPSYVLSPLTAHLVEITRMESETSENPRHGRFELKFQNEQHLVEFALPVEVRLYPVEFGQRIHLEFVKREPSGDT